MEDYSGTILYAAAIDILGLDAGLSFADIGLGPSESSSKLEPIWTGESEKPGEDGERTF